MARQHSRHERRCGAVETTHLREVANPEHEADAVEDVGFAAAIEASDGIEMCVEPRDAGAGAV